MDCEAPSWLAIDEGYHQLALQGERSGRPLLPATSAPSSDDDALGEAVTSEEAGSSPAAPSATRSRTGTQRRTRRLLAGAALCCAAVWCTANGFRRFLVVDSGPSRGRQSSLGTSSLDAVARKDEGAAALCQELWSQCGGTGWSGGTCCHGGGKCVKKDDYYSQCVPNDDGGADDGEDAGDEDAYKARGCSDAPDSDADECGKLIRASMPQVWAHPDWYSGITTNSTFKEFQAYFHWAKKGNCRRPCSPGSCEWTFRFQGCDAWEEWNCRKEDDDGSLAYDCCCKRYHLEGLAAAVTAAASPEGANTSTEMAPEIAFAHNATADATAANVTLFCTALMLPRTYEVELLREQLVENGGRVGLFACEDWAIFSNESVRLTPDSADTALLSEVFPGSLEAKRGGEFNTVLNTPIFIRFWAKIMVDARTWRNSWTVKVDPDTLFFPDRLRSLLSSKELSESTAPKEGRYLNNCPVGLHGPIEVVSRAALRTYNEQLTVCNEGSPSEHGQEDWFLRACFKALGVERVDAFNTLLEGHWQCSERPSSWHPHRPPCFSPQVAFHPFKTIEAYRHCLSEALEHPPATALAPYGLKPSHENEQHA